jgi:predicted transcriptional regulator
VELPDDLHRALTRLAAAQERSVNEMVLIAVVEYLERNGKRSRIRQLAEQVADRHAELLARLAR